ncbi:MAG: hypothetical protein Q9209_006049 [Squamulea sp. 1 TL-2023]
MVPQEDVKRAAEDLRVNDVVETANEHRHTIRPLPRRESPSSTMPAFITSAPGKVIVYGEHAVVYGEAAMAAAISLRSYLLVTPKSEPQRTTTLRFPDIGMEHSWRMDDLPWSAFSHPSKKKHYDELVDKLDAELVEAMQPNLSVISPKASPADRKIHQAAGSAFLYMFLSLGYKNLPSCIYTLRSTIPIGAGLGSSASICACLSSAILLQLRALSSPYPDQPLDEAEMQIERINQWAFVGEMCIHGNPSGVDNTVATGGRAVVFRRSDSELPPTVTPIRNFPVLPLLLVNTRQSRSTATEVAKVAALRRVHPAVTEPILEAIGKITETAYNLISLWKSDSKNDELVQALGDLMRINHGLLVALGVSHPKFERIRELVDSLSLGWTKLTGAGGGGSAIALLNTSASPSTLQILQERLDDEGFEKYETILGGDGVGVLWPAVPHKGHKTEGGDEIDPETFLNAQGAEGIEKLVGVRIDAFGKSEGWKFWSNFGPHVVKKRA